MSLDAPPSADLGLRPRVAVVVPEVDAYTEGVRCPRCQREHHTVGTPGVPVEIVADDELVVALQADDVDELPVFGWRCDRHRVDVVLPAPFAIAPEPYRPVEATLDGEDLTLAVPAPVLGRYR